MIFLNGSFLALFSNVILVPWASVLMSYFEEWGFVMPGLGPKLTTLKECATVVVLKLFFSTKLPFYQFLAHCVEN